MNISEHQTELDEMVEKGMGYVEDSYDPRDFDAEAFLGGVEEFEEEFLVDVPFVTYQGRMPSCTAHAVTTHKWKDEEFRGSPRFNFAWSKYNDGYTRWGTSLRNAMSILVDKGFVAEEHYPDENKLFEKDYTDVHKIPVEIIEAAREHKAESYVRKTLYSSHKARELMRTIKDAQSPIAVSMTWRTSYNHTGASGILGEPQGNSSGHAFVYLGWIQKYGKRMHVFQNSFGDWWADKGRFYLEDDECERLNGGAWFTVDIDKETAKKQDIEFKKLKKEPMLKLKELEGEGKILIQRVDNGTFYINVGDKLLEVSKERAGEAALTAITRAGGGIGVEPEYLKGLVIKDF